MVSPSISVIVPSRDGAPWLPTFLSAMATQTLEAERFEVVVVVHKSRDNSIEVLERSGLSNLRWLSSQEGRGSYRARHQGCLAARGQVFAFIDVDCIPAPDWLERIGGQVHRLGGGRVLTGQVVMFPKGSHWTPLEWVDRGSLNQEVYFRAGFGATANLCVGREAYFAAGGFDDVVSGGDRRLCEKLSERGFELDYRPALQVRHPARSTLWALLRKSWRVGYGKGECFWLDRPALWAVCLFALRTALAALVQPHQWRRLRTTGSGPGFSAWGRLQFALGLFATGAVNRCSTLVALILGARRGAP